MADSRGEVATNTWQLSVTIDTFSAIAKALSDSHRIRMLLALQAGELCACQIIELVRLAPSTVSKHMAVLRDAGLVSARKQGRWIYYRMARVTRDHPVGRLVSLCAGALAADRLVAQDRRRLKAICAVDPAALCRARRTSAAACCRKLSRGRESVWHPKRV